MAEIVQSLFGVTPESYQQAQQARMDAQALQYAKLDPFQQANYAIGRGASGLAGAIGSALGGQDPELQRITMRQQIAGQIDYNDEESMKRGIVALNNAGDPAGAMQLQQILLSQQAKRASIYKDESAGKASLAAAGREKIPPTSKEAQLARDVALLSGPEGSIEYNTAYAKSLQEQAAPKEVKDARFGDQAERYAKSMFGGKTYAQLTPAEAEVVNKRVEDEQSKRAEKSASKLVLPGDKALVDIPAFRAKVQATIEPQSKAINAADQALEAIETSLATGNFASYRAAQTQFVRAISGAGDLSQRELKAAGADPSLLGGTADYLSSLFTSTPTTDTQNKIKVTLEAIRKVAAKKASAEVDQQRKIALRSPGYNVDAVTEALTFPELAPRVAAPAPGAAGGDLAAQAAAEIARRAAGKAK